MRVWMSVCVLMACLAVAACSRAGADPPAADMVGLETGDAGFQADGATHPGIIQVQSSGVVINGYALSRQELAELGNGIPAGNYWYDGVAGFWGYVGGPVQGQVMPGYSIGRLRQDASAGRTGTIINGREIPMAEVAWLSGQVPVQRGRFWMNPQGFFGYEGGPAVGRIALGGQGAGGGNRPSLSERGMLFRPGEILSGR